MIKDQMDKIYRDVPLDKIPWIISTPPEILQKVLEANVQRQGKVIEFGCGTGNYVIWFAIRGYEITGVDISKNAIEIAKISASTACVNCEFMMADVTGNMPKTNDMFDFAYDWELLHHIFPEDRNRYLRNVVRLLNPGGKYLSVCFSEDNPQFGGVGKYRKTPLGTTLYFSSEEELKELFGGWFDIEELRTTDIKGKNVTHRAVYALMKKKGS